MSLWRVERYRLGLAPGAALLASVSGQVVAPVRIAADEPATDGAPWAALVSAFRAALKAIPRPERSTVTVVLHTSLVRLRVVPWHDEFATADLRRAFASHSFVDAYGERARHWQVRLSDGQYGDAALGCAIDSELLETLQAQAHAARVKLSSIQPYCTMIYDRFCRQFGHGNHWFACQESGHLTLLLSRDGIPELVRTYDIAVDDLAPLLDREWIAAGIDSPPCPVYFYKTPGAEGSGRTEGRWRVQSLDSTLDLFGRNKTALPSRLRPA